MSLRRKILQHSDSLEDHDKNQLCELNTAARKLLSIFHQMCTKGSVANTVRPIIAEAGFVNHRYFTSPTNNGRLVFTISL